MRTKIGSLVTGIMVALFISACASVSEPHPLVGGWAITIDTPIGAMDANLTVNEDLTGEMSSQDLGGAALEAVSVDGENVSFSTTVDAQGQSMTLVFNGTVVEDRLSGSFNTDFGAIPVTGTRL
ncbi:MAG: hypothetical protein WD071_08885 [Pseudohongiella sp.]|uniref:hypothetical protein n=1 Tax=Pseudohongiella sp. TaxID=1979412 RepID=UPI0034A09679